MLKSSKPTSNVVIPKTQLGSNLSAVPLKPVLNANLALGVEKLSISPVVIGKITDKKKPPQTLKVPIAADVKPDLIDRASSALMDSSGFDFSSSNKNTKTYDVGSGISETEPDIVLMSEFVPIYDESSKNNKGRSVEVKETAKNINAKTAVSVVSQDEGIKDQISTNKERLDSFVEQEDFFMTKLTDALDRAVSSLDVSSFTLPKTSYEAAVTSFKEVLYAGGYSESDVASFSPTKVWQQTLVEAKRSVMTHTPGLIAQNFVRKDEEKNEDPYVLSDVIDPPASLIRLWLNPYHGNLPTLSNLTSKNLIQDNVTSLLKVSLSQYINMSSANVPEKTQVLLNSPNKTENVTKLSFIGGGLIETVLSKVALMKYETSGRDVSVIANILSKEAAYSSFLTNKENSKTLSSKFGFTPSTTNDNFSVWDSVIGKFPEVVTNVVQSPSGNGNSLVSLSQEIVQMPGSTDVYNVMTFEKDRVGNTNVTPGTYYYLDSSLQTVDGKSFDSTRLKKLSSRVKSGIGTCNTIYSILGYDSVLKTKKKVLDTFELETIVDKTDVVTKAVLKCLKVSDPLQIVSSIESFISEYVPKLLSKDESLNIRLASIVCKCAVSPGVLYEKVSETLKVLLFMWLLNIVMKQVDGVQNDTTIAEIKSQITACLDSARVDLDTAEITKASDEGRTFPLDVGDTAVYVSSTQDDIEEVEKTMRTQQALSNYKSASGVGNRMFEQGVDESKGLWRCLVDLLKSVYVDETLFVSGFTTYSHVSKLVFLFNYFDLLLKVISTQTPESLQCSYVTQFEYVSDYNLSVGGYSAGDPKNQKQITVTIQESGLYLSPTTNEQIEEYYDKSQLLNASLTLQPAKSIVKKLIDAISFLKTEEEATSEKIAIFYKFLMILSINLSEYSSFMDKNFESYLTMLKSMFDSDVDLSDKQKNALINSSLSEEQLKMSRYVLSELSDRLKSESSKLSSLPMFVDFPNGFEDYMNVNDVEHVSFQMLSPYFTSKEFLAAKGHNKKIIQIGIPPTLNRTLRSTFGYSSDRRLAMLQSIVRVKVYKIDKLHPDVVFLPKSYLFEMNRFPTRVLDNWDFDAFFNEETNILTIPTKVVVPGLGVNLNKNFTEAFSTDLYGDTLTQEEEFEIYMNHAVSFLAEEYVKWFTDCKFEEARYHIYSALKKDDDVVDFQYSKCIQSAASKKSATNYGNVIASFRDPVSGNSYSVPISKPSSKYSFTTTSKIGVNDKFASQTITYAIDKFAIKPIALELTDTLRMFFKNETFLLDPEKYMRRVLYPKKFDRVFSMIIDPDDFFVDESMTSSKTLEALRKVGVLTGGPSDRVSKAALLSMSQPYKHRDTTTDDVIYEEYFATVEPYDYVQEYGS